VAFAAAAAVVCAAAPATAAPAGSTIAEHPAATSGASGVELVHRRWHRPWYPRRCHWQRACWWDRWGYRRCDWVRRCHGPRW
jgi:hypothetical protein